MPHGRSRAGVALVAALPPSAAADLVQCQRAIVKSGLKFVQTKTKTLAKCEASIVNRKFAGAYPDPQAANTIANAAAALAKSIDKACGGTDELCGRATTPKS